MLVVLVYGLLTLICLLVSQKTWMWRKNYYLALKMGFPVYASPIYLSDAWWMISYPFLLPVLERLPRRWTNPWLPMAKIWLIWRAGHTPFAEAGTDSFVVATPNGNMLWTSDHAVISQLLTHHPKSEVPVEMVKFFDIWGPTLGSVVGEEWKSNRRVITAGLGTTINSTVWQETTHQTQTLIKLWTSQGGVVPQMHSYTKRLALHVISCGVFGMDLRWDEDESVEGAQVPPGHSISFDRALITMLKRLATVHTTPRFLLDRLPFEMFREANLGFTETTKYLKELHAKADSNLEEVAKKKQKSLLESIVLSGADPEISGKRHLSNENVMGNLFFSLLAGHEATGGSIGFIYLLMAIYPEMQKAVQDQLDQQFDSRAEEEQTFEQDCRALQEGYIGAVQKEVTALWNPASFIIRKINESISVVDTRGQLHQIPTGTLAPLAIAAANRNTIIWDKPERPQELRERTSDSPALFFNPDRWLGTDNDVSGHKKSAMSQKFPKWFAFGQGPRTCPGRGFAETEMTAAMATLFKDFSLELVVSAQTLRRCDGDEKKAWKETQEYAIRMLYDDVKQNIAIALEHDLPVRIVRRAK